MSRQDPAIIEARNVAVEDYVHTAELARHLTGVDALIHLAAQAHQDSVGPNDDALFREANVDTTLDMTSDSIFLAGFGCSVVVSSIGVVNGISGV